MTGDWVAGGDLCGLLSASSGTPGFTLSLLMEQTGPGGCRAPLTDVGAAGSAEVELL